MSDQADGTDAAPEADVESPGAEPSAADRGETTPEAAFDRTLEEGRRRLNRGMWPTLATGAVGGLDVGTGVFALLLVEAVTKSRLLGGLAFGIGFIALLLANSELFTENFLVPVIAVVARKSRLRELGRLWVLTLVMNLVGGWVLTGLVISGFPSVHKAALESGKYYIDLGLGWRAFSLALLGGLVITLMTWMQHSTESVPAKVVVAVTSAFLLGAGRLNHAIVASLLMFAALQTGHAPFGYLNWLAALGWAILGNVVGGVGLVTVLRLMQVPHRVVAERGDPQLE